MEMASGIARGEVCLRVSVILVLVLTACLVAFDTQTKVIILTIEKKATYTDMDALKILVYITSAVAGYNLLQLCRHCVLACFGGNSRGFNSIYMAWVCLLLDQMAMYMTLAANSATVEGSALALGGSKALEWMKVCNKFTRFCNQIGGAVLCGYVAFILLALISSLSAYNLFRFYSPKWFLRLKSA